MTSRIDEASGATLQYADLDDTELTDEQIEAALNYVSRLKLKDEDLMLEALGLTETVSLPSGKAKCPDCDLVSTPTYIKRHNCKGRSA